MDYELMMNGNVKIGQKAPDFEGTSLYANNLFIEKTWTTI